MSDAVFALAIKRIEEYCQASGQRFVNIIFHGGEPTLIGHTRFAAFCHLIRESFVGFLRVQITLQTNGTVLTPMWARILRHYDVQVGISLDGPEVVNDRNRVTQAGKGSYQKVRRGIQCLLENGVTPAILCVIPFGEEPLTIHQHFVSLGVDSIQYLFPDYTHDSIKDVHTAHGTNPCFDFLAPILDFWWRAPQKRLSVEPFDEMIRILFGERSRVDYFGNRPIRSVFIESEGAIEGLDVLRACGNGMSATGLNVQDNRIVELLHSSSIHRIFAEGVTTPIACNGCVEHATCSGGYLPHRYSMANKFENRSVWCEDILRLFARARSLMRNAMAEDMAAHMQTCVVDNKCNFA